MRFGLRSVPVLLGGRRSLRRALSGGLFLGVALAVSRKTTLLAAALRAGAILAAAACSQARVGRGARRAPAGALAVTAGSLVVPA